MIRRIVLGAAILSAAPLAVQPAQAQGVIDQWTQVKPPPVPMLQHVAADPKTTALLVLDFVHQTCDRMTRCLASLPDVALLLKTARSHHARVIYSGITGAKRSDVMKDLTPRPNEPMVFSGPDKFLNTKLDTLLRRDGIKTVIVTGTAANAAVLSTASEAAYRGYNVIVPVDGMSDLTLYPEQYVAWDVLHAPGLAKRTTLTSTKMISFDTKRHKD